MIRLRQAQSQNPLTHLPANDAILDFIGRAAADRSVNHAFCHLDFNNFKPFNDVYGFHVGDRAIIMFAELLRAEFGHDNAFVGHIGGDDFFVGTSGTVRISRSVCCRCGLASRPTRRASMKPNIGFPAISNAPGAMGS